MALTAEQKARKNQLARERAAAKKAQANAVAPVSEPTQVEAPAAPADPILSALVGQTVTAPVTGLDLIVQRSFRAGGRFLTEDGERVWGNACPHSADERVSRGTTMVFEQVGDGNPDWPAGATGTVHRFSRCNKFIAS